MSSRSLFVFVILAVLLTTVFTSCSHTPHTPDIPDYPKNSELAKIPDSCRPNSFILQNQIQPEELEKRKSQNPLMQAVFAGDASQIKELIASGQDINAKDAHGLSYLHLAAAVGCPQVIRVLVDAGLPINAKLGTKKSTPAHSAARWGRLEAIQTLVNRGADFQATDADGKTPAQLAEEADHVDVVQYLKTLRPKK